MRRVGPALASVAAALVVGLTTAACGSSTASGSGTPAPAGAGTAGPSVGAGTRAGSGPGSGPGSSAGSAAGTAISGPGTATTPEPARIGRTAASERVRFVPTQVMLPGGQRAPVVPARTVGGELRVPDDIRSVGWWDGSAWAGDLFGGVVIAGHVDAPRQGLGYFARLLRLTPGETVTLTGDGHRAAYRVVSVTAVHKDALSAASPPFDQRVGHRLVLMTCTGTFDRATRSYDQNLVVVAEPVGDAR